MIKQLITEFPLSDVPRERSISREKITKYAYTKEEVDLLLNAAVISMILGFTTLALFVDGLLRMLGIIPPFMEIDINILDKIETDMIDKIRQVPVQKLFQHGFR